MGMKSHYLGSQPINGADVSFFSPPHDEPDFIWVDLQALARAFLPEEDAARMVKHAHRFDDACRPAQTAVHGDRIVTIVSHPMAHGFCSYIDETNGYVLANDGWDNGPAALAYIVAMADAQHNFMPLGFDGLAKAFNNAGGPSMRGLK